MLDFAVGHRNVEAVAELLERLEVHLLGLMRHHLRFAGRAHAIALDGLGEDQRRLALVLGRRLVGRENLARVMAAARQLPDLLVRPVGDHCRGLGIAAEEFLADIGAVLGLEILIFAVDAFFHQLAQAAGHVLGQKLVPARAPDQFDDVPAGAAEIRLKLLDDLAVAAHRAVEALQVAVDDEDEIVEFFASRQRNGAERFRLVHLAVAHEGPDFALLRLGIRPRPSR